MDVAVKARQVKVIQLLVKRGCDPNLKYLVTVDDYAYKLKKYTKQVRHTYIHTHRHTHIHTHTRSYTHNTNMNQFTHKLCLHLFVSLVEF